MSNQSIEVFVIRFDLADFDEETFALISVLDSTDGSSGFVYLRSEQVGRVAVGVDKQKALSFSSAYLAVQFLDRNDVIRKLRSFAFIDRFFKDNFKRKKIKNARYERFLMASRSRPQVSGAPVCLRF